MKTLTFMVVAGEASGDAHAAKLVQALRAGFPDTNFEFFGSAGQRLRDAGVEAVVEADHLSIVGLAEIGNALPIFLKAFRELKNAALQRKPYVVILVDFPEFNLKLAKTLKKRGFRVVYYISPQLWSWRKYRVRTIRKHVDLLLTILPFEKDWYLRHGVSHIEYVGNPLVNEVRPTLSKKDFCGRYDIRGDQPIVTFLPGSRYNEIVRILPPMLEAAAEMLKASPGIQFVVALASELHEAEVLSIVLDACSRAPSLEQKVKMIKNETYNALNASDAAAIASGTATLEAGIIGTPMTIVYKTSSLNYYLFKPMTSAPHIGLINLIAGRRMSTELLQNEFTAAALSTEMLRLLTPDVNKMMRSELKQVTETLGSGGASKRVAEAIMNLIHGSSRK